MINYEEELKKFEPCLDVDEAEGAIYDRELIDAMDIIKDLIQEMKVETHTTKAGDTK